MKNLLIFLLIVSVFSCTKQEMPRLTYREFANLLEKDVLTEVEEFKMARGGVKGKPKPTDPSPPPPSVIKDTVGIAVVMLDNDGHYQTSPRFTNMYMRGTSITEVQMQTIKDSIAYDYQDWKIIFTTDETVYQAAPVNKRMRIVFTIDYEWYPGYAGGVAAMYSFDDGNETPCFVFVGQDRIQAHETKWLWEAGGHELGHTFGLAHIAQWVNDILINNLCNLGDVPGGFYHNMGIPYYGITKVAPGRMANGVWDYPGVKIPPMLD